MPTYEYACVNNHSFEEFQSMMDAPIEICPLCGGKAERKISGGSGLIFKGSGFYITDYKKSNVSNSEAQKKAADSPKPVEKPTAPSPTKTESSTEKKSDSQ
jgi:putative FmdB family regulatory protein